MRVSGERCHTPIFKDKDNKKILVYIEKYGLQNSFLGFFKFGKIWEFIYFWRFLLILKKSKFTNFENPEYVY